MNLADIQQFRNNYGLGIGKINLVQNATPGTNPDDELEADLDLEWAGAIASNATLIYVYSSDVSSSVFYAIDQNLAPVVSESFGDCEANIPLPVGTQHETEAKKGMRWESRGWSPAAIRARLLAITARRLHR